MLGINVIYELKPGQRQDFLDCLEAAGIRAAVLAEPGCLKYDFYCSVDNPDELLLDRSGGPGHSPEAAPHERAAGAEGPLCGGLYGGTV